MTQASYQYPIGTPGVPWGDKEKAAWFAAQTIKRSYFTELVEPLKQSVDAASVPLHLKQYGVLEYEVNSYPLFAVVSAQWNNNLPTALITGGVHGYETSGVQGALRFIQTTLVDYAKHFNFIVAPCVSPWGYETINRWNPQALDPNRSFFVGSGAQESELLMTFVESVVDAQQSSVLVHIDLHETTDTDNSEFRPALQARDALEQKVWEIPDGFYCVGDSENPVPEFQRAVIESVAKVTHIAQADDSGRLIGAQLEQAGVINYPKKELFLCGGFTNAQYVTTTEVYPDSPRVDAENCIEAQVAALRGGLDFVLNKNLSKN